MPENYYNNFDPEKNYNDILYRDGYTLQGAELNEQQSAAAYRLKGVADALFRDGDIVSDAQIVIDKDTGQVRASAGAVYINGAVRNVAPAEFTIPTVGTLSVGIHLAEKVISELDDPTLYNPAIGSRGEGESGAWRLQVTPVWGHSNDGIAGEFYPIYSITDAEMQVREAPPAIDAFSQGLARYDRDSTGTGSYVVSGLNLQQAEDNTAGKQVYTLSEGRARVNGYGVDLATARRLIYDAQPDIRQIDIEVHPADASSSQSGGQRITLAHPPLHQVDVVRITTRKTIQLTHGAYTGAQDTLPDTAVVAIIECRQGDTVYTQGTDFKKTGDKVDWSLSGAEPATGSTYSCTYDSIIDIEPVNVDYDGFSVEGAVNGSSILVTYKQALPRYDRLAINQDGQFLWFKGVAAELYARPPLVPAYMLALATVHQTWRDVRSVVNDGVRVVPFNEIVAINERIEYVLKEIARQRLEADIFTREAGARVGIFVDPLMNDDMRDQGIEQTGAIINGSLMLPILGNVTFFPVPALRPYSPDYDPAVILSQPLRTGNMAVNPYMSFDVLPARVALNPANDYWTTIETMWASQITQRFETGHYVPGNSTLTSSTTTSRTELLATASKLLEYLREIAVAFRIEGFGAGEILASVIFDGVPATFAAATANEDGVVESTFTIPPKIPAGAKTVVFTGQGGTTGTTSFVGQGTLTVQALRQINTVVNYWVDPLAQTFVLEANAQICGVDLYFTAKSGEVRVQIREVQSGVPARVILAEAVLQPGQINTANGESTRVLFDIPVYLNAGIEYAIVILCNDPTTAVAIAEMGKFDAYKQQWVAVQPYTVGVLLSSSNASSWTVHQDKDLAFQLLATDYPQGVKSLELGAVYVTAATDMVVLALEDLPDAGARIEYEVELPDGNTLLVAHGQTFRPLVSVTGEIVVTAKLSGTEHTAPLLWPGAQFLAGVVSQTADYYTRSIPAFGATKAVMIYDAVIPSGATVTPEIRMDDGAWESLTSDGTTQQGDGLVEYRFSAELEDVNELKARLTLTGTSAARPTVRNIRLMAVM
jgi:hypothetical protein